MAEAIEKFSNEDAATNSMSTIGKNNNHRKGLFESYCILKDCISTATL
jgi:hypothetical protein